MSNNICPKAARLLVYATLVAVTTVHAAPSYGQDAEIKKQLEGVDLEGVQQLRLSPNGELVAGLTRLYENPGTHDHSGDGHGDVSSGNAFIRRPLRLYDSHHSAHDR